MGKVLAIAGRVVGTWLRALADLISPKPPERIIFLSNGTPFSSQQLLRGGGHLRDGAVGGHRNNTDRARLHFPNSERGTHGSRRASVARWPSRSKRS
jgi:hypothetical protein